VCTAEHGAEGIHRLQEESFDLVISDLVMPELDRFAVMDYLRSHVPSTVVVVITGYASTESAIKALRKGAYDYLTKPIDFDLMHLVIERALEKLRLQKSLHHYIDEVKARAEALRESEARYRSLAEHAPDIIFLLDSQGCFVFLNQRVEELLGYRPEALLGRPFTDLFAAESQTRAKATFHKSVKSVRCPVILPLLSWDSTTQVWAEISMVPLYDVHGQLLSVQGIARDITRRKEMEEQLLRSEKLAAVGQLAAGVAHELGNALGVIGGSVQYLLENWKKRQPYHEFLEVIHRNVLQADRALKSLFSFARPRAPVLAPLDVISVLKETCLLLKGECAKQHIRILKRFSPTLPLVMADREQLQQVFLNLLLNAIQAMPGGGSITLTTTFDAKGHQVKIAVADTGGGISPEYLSRIFEPFFTMKKGGTGLGLCVSERLISAHGGNISVSSQEGKGSIFTLSLPATDSRGLPCLKF
jgi:PAS domain S-box-containing protein